jgi:arylsulfatase A-like enzyme
MYCTVDQIADEMYSIGKDLRCKSARAAEHQSTLLSSQHQNRLSSAPSRAELLTGNSQLAPDRTP